MTRPACIVGCLPLPSLARFPALHLRLLAGCPTLVDFLDDGRLRVLRCVLFAHVAARNCRPVGSLRARVEGKLRLSGRLVRRWVLRLAVSSPSVHLFPPGRGGGVGGRGGGGWFRPPLSSLGIWECCGDVGGRGGGGSFSPGIVRLYLMVVHSKNASSTSKSRTQTFCQRSQRYLTSRTRRASSR